MTRIFTIGHSTRTLDEVVQLLQANHVDLVADVRTVPASRRMPHFGKASLERELPLRGIRYVHVAALGGLRKTRPDSINAAWRNASFRGYADHMQSAEFERGIEELQALAASHTVAVMCAEAVPWRCHRSLLADALTVRGVEVLHITGPSRPSPHSLTPFARVDDGRITYPGPDTLPL